VKGTRGGKSANFSVCPPVRLGGKRNFWSAG
jgi:hypothetical protein